jgi:hypothetical protein
LISHSKQNILENSYYWKKLIFYFIFTVFEHQSFVVRILLSHRAVKKCWSVGSDDV